MLCTKLLGLMVLWHGIQADAKLLFSAPSVLQITSAVSAPIVIPGRRLYWDWGIQMNYDLPTSLKQFQNVPIWPGKWDRKRRDLPEQRANQTLWSIADKYHTNELPMGRHPSDFTAGEFYFALENLLISYGFHEMCLLRSVCELAQHPFADDQQNLITEILTFVLTPSVHNAFAETESMYRETYEQAEQNGFLHFNCTELYGECEQDLLTAVSKVITLS